MSGVLSFYRAKLKFTNKLIGNFVYRDDPELDKMLKETVRWGDPMDHLVKVFPHQYLNLLSIYVILL